MPAPASRDDMDHKCLKAGRMKIATLMKNPALQISVRVVGQLPR
jgi:hypothetical protein